MAFDGIITRAMTRELRERIMLGKIEKIYQPEREELLFHIHTKDGNVKLFASCASSAPRINLTDMSFINPPAPSAFCMLMRKHLQGGRIVGVDQVGCERILTISLETLNELGFTVSKKLIFEIMGKHSNIILIDTTDGTIIDSIKRVSIDTSRVRQVLPGKIYEFPPAQDKIPFESVTEAQIAEIPRDRKSMLSSIGGISPAIAEELALSSAPFKLLRGIIDSVDNLSFVPRIYVDQDNVFREYHICDLSNYENVTNKLEFQSLSECLDSYFENKNASNRVRQRSHQLTKHVSSLLDKLYLKLQRLNEDLSRAENSEDLRLYGELLTANIHLAKPGDSKVRVINYYDGSEVEIPLDPRYSAAKNAQIFYKKYGKAKTAVKEKQIQIAETSEEIAYLESTLSFLENTDRVEDVDALRRELVETGYLRKRKQNFKEKKLKPVPYKYETSTGKEVKAGRNNKENDYLTLKLAGKTDYWFHTKDIPGSHVILFTYGEEPTEAEIFETAGIAAYHSKGRNSENVPVDYVQVKYVKKPTGAKPGMVIFTNNRTVWVDPKVPESEDVKK